MGRPDTDTVGFRTLVPTLTAQLPQIVSEVVDLLRDEWSEFAQLLDNDAEEILQTAEVALLHLLSIAEQVPNRREPISSPAPLGQTSVFEEVGRTEWREGRSLGTLLSAYRAGARVAWRHLSASAVDRGLDPASVAALAEAVFVFVEELSSASARGYVDEQRVTSAERQRLRAQLAELLLSDRSDSTLIRAMSLRAGWPMPAGAALILVDPDDERASAFLDRLDPSSLPVRHGGLAGAILPDPEAPGRRTVLEHTLRGCGAVIGTAVSPASLPSSVRVAEAALRLARAGVLTGDPVFVADHYDTLVVARDPWLSDRLREQVLAPLATLPAATRTRLEETLAAWLAAMGDRQAAARALQVHPQTVRYRLRQIQAAFGETLDDPAVRLRLTLALCWPRAVTPDG
jgi:hypothetical protein